MCPAVKRSPSCASLAFTAPSRLISVLKRPRGASAEVWTTTAAIDEYAADRRSQVSERMVAWWKENARPLAAFFGDKPLRKISPVDIAAYQNARRDLGRAPKTINGELSVLRQLLKHAKLWYRFAEEYHPLKNTKPPAGQALTDEAQAHLFATARSKAAWMFAYVAATLDFFAVSAPARSRRSSGGTSRSTSGACRSVAQKRRPGGGTRL